MCSLELSVHSICDFHFDVRPGIEARRWFRQPHKALKAILAVEADTAEAEAEVKLVGTLCPSSRSS